MRFRQQEPPRVFEVGFGEIASGTEYDVVRKSWGFYPTPSLNGRLEGFGLRGVLVKNRIGRYFVLLIERGREELFERYVRTEEPAVVSWLDSNGALERLERGLG